MKWKQWASNTVGGKWRQQPKIELYIYEEWSMAPPGNDEA